MQAAPLLVHFILNPPLEENIQRALMFADRDTSTFLNHAIAAGMLALLGVLLVLALAPSARGARKALR